MFLYHRTENVSLPYKIFKVLHTFLSAGSRDFEKNKKIFTDYVKVLTYYLGHLQDFHQEQSIYLNSFTVNAKNIY